ncbi:hypothetical protein L2E82_32463 [Cichorium intybus]|uniref:Uncharacterized protein n=1 Tax=Cichorium intybus TaxID=13427 RepID=A0ACB9BH98_CICIN|nr:hypothetical protein L2E82_32463 [Cichorium intybus]
MGVGLDGNCLVIAGVLDGRRDVAEEVAPSVEDEDDSEGIHLALLLIMSGGTLSAAESIKGSVTVPLIGKKRFDLVTSLRPLHRFLYAHVDIGSFHGSIT